MGAAAEEIVRKYGQELELKVLTDDQSMQISYTIILHWHCTF